MPVDRLAPELCSHAESAYPDEACGLLLGPIDPDASPAEWTVVRATNTAVRPRAAFRIGPEFLRRTEQDASAGGRTVVGIYHSHPDAAAEPSDLDHRLAWPGFLSIVIEVRAGRARRLIVMSPPVLGDGPAVR